MPRFVDQNASTKVTAASTTNVFTAQDFDATGIVKLLFFLTGAGMVFGDITRFRVKNGGITTHDFSPAQFQAWYQKYYGVAPVTADVAFDIPFHLPYLGDSVDAADICQMVPGGQPAIEIVVGAGGAAGTIQMGWIKTTVAPSMYPILLGSSMQIAASSNNAHYPLADPGVIKGVIIPTTGLTRFNLTLGGARRINIEGTTTLAQSQRERNAQVVTDPICSDLGGPQPAPSGNSYVEMDTAAGWVGAANEVCLYGLRGIAK